MRQQRKHIAILLLILLTSSTACTKSPSTNPPITISDPLRAISVQVARLSDATNAAARTVIALAQDGMITQAQEREALLVVKKANDGAGLLTDRLKSLSTLDESAKTSLLSIVNEINLALADPKTLALFNISNPKSKERINAAINVMVNVVGVLKNALSGGR